MAYGAIGVKMSDQDYKFKTYTRTNPVTGQTEYQTLMMGKSDGKDITYRTAFHRSKDMAQNEINRAIGSISATKSGSPVSVKQEYNSRKVQMNPNENISNVLQTGGQIKPSNEYDEISYKNGFKTTQRKSQTGVRKGPEITGYASNMLDLNYDRYTDETPQSLMRKFKRT